MKSAFAGDVGCFTQTQKHQPASRRLRPDLNQNEAHALQVLDVLLEEVVGDVQQPRLLLQSAGEHLCRVGAVAPVSARRGGVAGAMPLLETRNHPETCSKQTHHDSARGGAQLRTSDLDYNRFWDFVFICMRTMSLITSRRRSKKHKTHFIYYL